MKMNHTYYKRLVEGYKNKTLTKRELTLFFDLLSNGELDFYLEEDMMINLPDEMIVHKKYPIKNLYMYIAAAMLCMIGFGYYFFSSKISNIQTTTASNTVQPGGNNAILTLSNGEQIILGSTSQEGNIEEGNLLLHNENGQIKYDLSTLNLSKMDLGDLSEKFNTIETPRGGTFHIILPDGSNVWLNSLSKITFPLVFKKDRREVLMEGEVFFDIIKNVEQPFFVNTVKQEIEVLGTSFNVNAYSDEPYIRTSLVTGHINLKAGNSSVQIKAGEEVLNINSNLKIQKSDIEQVTSWKDGYFRFDKVDVRLLMRQIGRWYGVNVKFIGPISDEKFVGKIKRSENIEKLIRIFNHGGMNVKLDGKTLLVKK